METTRAVLATVVALDGSSYRRPGVRMLIFENGQRIGAVSGGCVEKEVVRQTESVFATGIPKVMTYDGRFRLGCEGILYILLEPFAPDNTFLTLFWDTIKSRNPFKITATYQKIHGENGAYGSIFHFKNSALPVRPTWSPTNSGLAVFGQYLQPCFKLLVIGAEHDAVQLCSYAAMTGWEVTIVADPKEEKEHADFPGADGFINAAPETIQFGLDNQTAVVLMTHSYVKDLNYLLALKNQKAAYFGLLGPARRREKLFDALLEEHPEVTEEFISGIHGPAGIDVGAETPQEIAISILAEILSVIHNKETISLKDKLGAIHG
ncbi:MAG: XdhC family protein [Bacteroidota bacterium]